MNNESIQYDCSRGCVVTHDRHTGETSCTYRAGCCKLGDYNWLKDAADGSYKDLFEVRFKNTRKGIYVNDSSQNIRIGDMVMVEAATGLDLGIVTLEGPIVGRQMKSKGIDPGTAAFRKIYRKARQSDIERWQNAIAREQETMIKARSIAAEMGLEMKIGDVEFQGDGTKAIFYYIADGRVDFRQLIKAFAEEFRIRIEMKQIGARQEAGLIGGLGICGRELCCANYISSFQSISTSAARVQDLSLNPQKLAGQCGKLKCCLNYEVPAYLDAQSRIPRLSGPLELEDGPAYLRKTDILSETMYFSYDRTSDANLYPLPASRVREILKMNQAGEKPESLVDLSAAGSQAPVSVDLVEQESLTRFDKRKKNKKRNAGRSNNTDTPRKEAAGGTNKDGGNTGSPQAGKEKRNNRNKDGRQSGKPDNNRDHKERRGNRNHKKEAANARQPDGKTPAEAAQAPKNKPEN